MVDGGDPFCLKLWVNRPRWSKIADFEQFDRSALAVTPSEKIQLTLIATSLLVKTVSDKVVRHTSQKSSINTNRKSTTRFPMSPIWTSYVVPKPQREAQKRSVQNLNHKLRYLRNGTRYDVSYYWSIIGSRLRAFHWYWPRWPWTA